MVAQTKKEVQMAQKKAAAAAATPAGKATTPAEKVQELVASARPLARQAHAAYQEHSPKAFAAYEEHQSKLPGLDLLLAIGLLFFGVHFSLCILAYRAFQLTGAQQIKKAYGELKAAYSASMSTLRKDPELVKLFDQDGDNEVTITELLSVCMHAVLAEGEKEAERLTVLKAMLQCLDPQKLVDALLGLWTGLAGMLVTLWSTQARGVMIGMQLQGAITGFAKTRVLVNLEKENPAYSQWIQFGFRGFGLLVGVVLAYLLASVSLAVTSALDGSRVVSARLIELAQAKGWMDEAKVVAHGGNVVLGVAALGAFSQLIVFDSVPWYLSLFFMPGLIAESTLGWFL